jgi:Undecaprenyl-phosphate glucose phosphotransferase
MSLFKHADNLLLSRSAAAEQGNSAGGSYLLRQFNPPTLNAAYFTIASFELLSVVTGALVAAGYHLHTNPTAHLIDLYVAAALFVGVAEVAISTALGQFSHLQQQTPNRYLWSGVTSVGLTFVLLTSAMFVTQQSADYSHTLLTFQLLLCCGAVLAFRSTAYSRFKAAVANGLIHGRRIVLIGRQKHFEEYARQLRFTGDGVQLICCQIPPRTADGGLCTTADSIASTLVAQCRQLQADDVILLVDEARQHELAQLTSSFREIPAAVYAIPRLSLSLWANAHLVEVAGVVAFGISSPPLTSWSMAIKRTFDFVFAAAALVALAPLLLLVSAAIALESGRPIFFAQTRHGYNNQPIRVLKFRTMRVSNDPGFLQATKGDPRITRLGRLLRISGIDELPQLVNILRGDMSIVGPRPHAIPHNEMFAPHIQRFSRRHNVKPGLTGWAQVNGYRGETDTFEKMARRIECDLYYVDNWSLLFDLQIIALTLFSKKTYSNAG